MKFIIEVPTAVDFPELTEVWEASVRATHDFLKEEDIRFYKPLVLNEFLKAVQLYCIKSDTGKIAGFMGLVDKSIEMLFIDPLFRGNGIGKTLVQFAVNACKADKVDVNEQNTQALGFYQKMDFAVTGRSEQDTMGKPYPILHMALNIKFNNQGVAVM